MVPPNLATGACTQGVCPSLRGDPVPLPLIYLTASAGPAKAMRKCEVVARPRPPGQTCRVTTEENDPWNSASTLDDLALATIAFLHGELQETPSHGGEPDEETAELIPVLTSINRAGLVTTGSQPGHMDEWGQSMQRAYLCVICDEQSAYDLWASVSLTDLVCIKIPPGAEGDGPIPVTFDDGKPFTWVGRYGPDEVDFYRNGSPELEAVLDGAWQLQIFDPTWGRKGRLWEVLEALLPVIREDDPEVS